MKRKRIRIEEIEDEVVLSPAVANSALNRSIHLDYLQKLNEGKLLHGQEKRESIILVTDDFQEYKMGTDSHLCNTSLELFKLTGKVRMTKSDAKQWVLDYAARHELFVIEDQGYIDCDDALRSIFLKPRIKSSQVRSYLNLNLYKPGENVERKLRKFILSRGKFRHQDNAETKPRPAYLSIGLCRLLGTNDCLSMSEVTSRMWQYIKQNGMYINCRIMLNDELKSLFEVQVDFISFTDLPGCLKNHLTYL